jgi:hypothetical protein
MPRIQWTILPANVREHLLDRVRKRAIRAQDLAALLAWINTKPELPEEAWCKDFGTFKLVGQGAIPKTFLDKDQPCFGERI